MHPANPDATYHAPARVGRGGAVIEGDVVDPALGVSYSSPGEVFFALAIDERTLPSEAPALPAEITHLWLMNPSGDRCIAWFPDRGWFDVARNWATD